MHNKQKSHAGVTYIHHVWRALWSRIQTLGKLWLQQRVQAFSNMWEGGGQHFYYYDSNPTNKKPTANVRRQQCPASLACVQRNARACNKQKGGGAHS